MILPTKHIPVQHALIGVGARVLARLHRPLTISALWERVRDEDGVSTFDRFVLALDLLFLLGAVHLTEGLIHRSGAEA